MRNDKHPIPSYVKKYWLLYGITAIIFITSLVGLGFAVLPNDEIKIQRDILFIISAVYLLASCSFFLWIYLRNQDQEFVGILPKAIDDLKRVGKEYYNNTAAIQDNSEFVEQLYNGIEQEFSRFLETHKLLEKLSIEVRQEKGNLQRELEKWQESTIEFFQLLERALGLEQNPDVQESLKKNLKEFERIVNKCGFYRIAPTLQDKFDDSQHEFKSEESSSDVESGTILKCEHWGYQSGAKVLQRAEVILAIAPENITVSEASKPIEISQV
ncbi:nucleotide exchange factor GrpE [Nodularia sp. UHCC 0506]|uniref:nucleotide exchange factor GrpE n=1 Tax=Nodularia sp. UHCC 0506 TaxID=3110243 RepID=UPI002B21F148|nr:nucleotide exchange factor GrpE [Nodularia sp. UHCC 0506]MEA5513333.1 nucleotide exchange factor GrpE [Nodularia sp. UHCC 0506]